ncbi:hypothetical protein BDV18DRAFT_163907 [Aspergillus unguis]
MTGPDRGYVLHAVSWPLLSLSVILTTLRFYVRTRIIRSCGWDDAFILLALACAAVNTIMIIISVCYGAGRHADTLSEYNRIQASKYQVLSQGFHVMSTNWGKVSVALFLIRVMAKVRNHVRAMAALIVVMSVVNIGCVAAIYGQCTPTQKLWDFSIPGKCWPGGAQKKYALFQSSGSAFTDLLLAVYPLFTIKDLQMATKVKVGLGCVLSLGVVAMAAAIVKTTYLPTLTSYQDYTWDTVDLTIWVAVEEYLIILAANMPALTPLFHLMTRHRSSKRSKSTRIDGVDHLTARPSHSRSHKTKGSGHKRFIESLTGSAFGAHSRSQSQNHPYRHGYRYSQNQFQSYVPFASVGRDYVEYPLTWTNSKPGPGSDEGENGVYPMESRSGNGSDGEPPIHGLSEPQTPRGILRTTEFRIKEVNKAVYDT